MAWIANPEILDRRQLQERRIERYKNVPCRYYHSKVLSLSQIKLFFKMGCPHGTAQCFFLHIPKWQGVPIPNMDVYAASVGYISLRAGQNLMDLLLMDEKNYNNKGEVDPERFLFLLKLIIKRELLNKKGRQIEKVRPLKRLTKDDPEYQARIDALIKGRKYRFLNDDDKQVEINKEIHKNNKPPRDFKLT